MQFVGITTLVRCLGSEGYTTVAIIKFEMYNEKKFFLRITVLNEKKLLLDDLDRRIIKQLQDEGRMSYKMIAKKLDVSEGTIRFRTKRMIGRGILKISASINPFIFENCIVALVGMQLEKRNHRQIMDELEKIPGVISICNTTGGYDLMVELFCNSRNELNSFLIDELSKIDGIRSTETYVYLEARNKWIRMP